MCEVAARKIVCVLGRTSSGKTSIAKEACSRLGLRMMKSYTSRPPRAGETERNTDHYFVDQDTIIKLLGQDDKVCAYTAMNGYYYLGLKEDLDHSDVYVIDPEGLEDLQRRYSKGYEFVQVYVRVAPQIGMRRAAARGDNLALFRKRYDAENTRFARYETDMPWDYHILNHSSLEDAVKKMCRILGKEFGREGTKTQRE